MNTSEYIEHYLKVSSTIKIHMKQTGEMTIEGCTVTMHDLDEDDKKAYSEEDESYNEIGVEAIILAFRYGLSHAIKYGSEKGFWNAQERAQLENTEVLRIIDIEADYSTSTNKQIVIE